MSIKRQLKYQMAVLFCLACFIHTSNADQVTNSDANLYKIGIGDILSITTWKEPDFTVDSVRVRSDGKITFPLLDDIQAEGLSTMVLKMAVQKKLSVYVEAPNVTVTLINPMSRQFYILGEILRTGEYPLIKKLTVMQAFALAGGFTEWADKNKIILYRRNNNNEETIIIRYKDIIKGDFSKDIQLQPDDTIIVP